MMSDLMCDVVQVQDQMIQVKIRRSETNNGDVGAIADDYR